MIFSDKAFEKMTTASDRLQDTQMLFQRTFEAYEGATFFKDEKPHGYFGTVSLMRKFYKGIEQWPDGVRKAMQEDGRQPVTYDRIKSALRLITGIERTQRSEARAVPDLKDQGEDVIDIVNPALKYFRKKNMSAWWNSEAFKDALITGTYAFEEGLDNPDGRFDDEVVRTFIKAENLMWDTASRRIDRSDASYCINFYSLSRRQFEAEYGEIKDADLQDYLSNGENAPVMSVDSNELGDDYKKKFASDEDSKSLFESKDRKTINIIRVWRVYREKVWAVKTNIGGADVIEKFKNEDDADLYIASIQPPDDIEVTFVKKTLFERRVSYHMIAGRKELEYTDDIGIDEIPVKSFYVQFDHEDGTFWGLVQEVKDNQEMVNQIYSTLLELIKKMPKITLEREEDALTKESESKLKQGFRFGMDLVYKKNRLKDRTRVTVAPGLEKFGALVNIGSDQKEHIQDALGARDVLEGHAPSSVGSGYGLNILRQQGMTVLQELFDHLSWFKESTARLEVKLLSLMEPGHIKRIVLGNIESKFDIRNIDAENNGGMNVQQQISEALTTKWETLWQKFKESEYYFSVEMVAHNNSEQMTRLMMLSEVSKSLGIPVPPELAVEYTPLPEDMKDYWKEYLRMMQMAAPVPDEGGSAPGTGLMVAGNNLK